MGCVGDVPLVPKGEVLHHVRSGNSLLKKEEWGLQQLQAQGEQAAGQNLRRCSLFFRCASISWFQVVSQPVIYVFQLAHLRVFQIFIYEGFPWDVTVNNGSWSPEVGSPPLVAFPGRENAFINCWNLQLKDDQWSFSNWKIGEPSVFVFCLGCSHILKSYKSGSGSQAFLGYNFKRGTLRGTFIADGQGKYQRNHLELPKDVQNTVLTL